MRQGSLDSASIMGAVGALATFDSTKDWGEWTRQSIEEVTLTLFLNSYFNIAPGLSVPNPGGTQAPGELYSSYDFACKELSNTISETNPKDEEFIKTRNVSQAEFDKWLSEEVASIKKVIEHTKKEKGYKPWIDWAVQKAFVDHAKRNKGLFNLEMIDGLSKVMDVDPKDLRYLWQKTNDYQNDYQQVKLWSKGKNQDSDFQVAKDAFVASAILRGRYHVIINSLESRHYMCHPIRQYILPPTSQGRAYPFSKPMQYLGSLVINGAMEEYKGRDRVEVWTENVNIIRKVLQNDFSMSTKDPSVRNDLQKLRSLDLNEDQSIDVAIQFAKKHQLRVHHKNMPFLISLAYAGVGALIGIPSFFVVSPWIGVLTTTGGFALTGIDLVVGVGDKVARKISLTDRHLKQLATLKPGRFSLYSSK